MDRSTSVVRRTIAFRNDAFSAEKRVVPEETAIAITVNGTTHAVMMATPDDLEDFALGLALNEGIVTSPDEIETLSVETVDGGIDCRVWLAADRAARYVARRRQMTGPVGCGLCGVDSLALAAPLLAPVSTAARVSPNAIPRAFEALSRAQTLGRLTRAVHAVGFADQEGMLLISREDVGRHNALDKVTGWLARAKQDSAAGFLVTTSRVSVELIQKAARMRCPLLAAVSAPTDLAIRTAHALGITLVAVARGDEFEIFTHASGIVGVAGATSDAA